MAPARGLKLAPARGVRLACAAHARAQSWLYRAGPTPCCPANPALPCLQSPSAADVLGYLEGKIAKWWIPGEVVFVKGGAARRLSNGACMGPAVCSVCQRCGAALCAKAAVPACGLLPLSKVMQQLLMLLLA